MAKVKQEYLKNSSGEIITPITSLESIPGLEKYIKDLVDQKIIEDNKKKYHVGKIIMSTENVNPNTYLGFGTWQFWGSGRVPVGVDASDSEFDIPDKTGGNKTHSHLYTIKSTITKNVIAGVRATNLTNSPEPTGSLVEEATGLAINTNSELGSGAAWNYNDGIRYTSSGKVASVSNISPYITCYMYKRIS